MANVPLNLDWRELLPGRDTVRSPEVEVIASSDSGSMDSSPVDGFPVAELPDQQLNEKIQRVSSNIASPGFTNRLPDRGEKLRSSLRQLQDELARRQLARTPKGVGDCERGTQSWDIESPDLLKDFNPNATSSGSQSSFALHFSENLSDKAGDAFSEELRFINGDKYKGIRDNGLQMLEGVQMLSQLTATFSRELPSQCFAYRKEQIFPNTGCRDSESSCIPANAGRKRKLCTRFSKRRRKPATRGSVDWEFKKVQDVVLLDDEDVQPIQIIQGDMAAEWMKCKIYYPSREDPESVEISYADIKCLDPESFLSSTIMNFYIQYLQRSSIRWPRGEYLLFNTYFYKKLMEAMSYKGDKTACFLKLRRWWKGVNIFQKAYILLPIHGDMHWSLVIICIPAKEDESGPIILHLDSLGLHSSNLIFDTVQSYLKEEWNYTKKSDPSSDIPISERIWRNLPRRIDQKKIMVPQQKNEYDCGLFVLYFMERFIREAPGRLRKKDLNMFGSKWFKPEEASGLRNQIRRLLIEEFENHRISSSPPSPGNPKSKSDGRKEDSSGRSEKIC